LPLKQIKTQFKKPESVSLTSDMLFEDERNGLLRNKMKKRHA